MSTYLLTILTQLHSAIISPGVETSDRKPKMWDTLAAVTKICLLARKLRHESCVFGNLWRPVITLTVIPNRLHASERKWNFHTGQWWLTLRRASLWWHLKRWKWNQWIRGGWGEWEWPTTLRSHRLYFCVLHGFFRPCTPMYHYVLDEYSPILLQILPVPELWYRSDS